MNINVNREISRTVEKQEDTWVVVEHVSRVVAFSSTEGGATELMERMDDQEI